MNSTIVEYIEGIEVIKAFGRTGVSYEKYAKAITDYRTFVTKWLSSTWVTMKLAFALFPSTLLGTLPVSLALAADGKIAAPEAALAVMLSLSMVGSLARLEAISYELIARDRLAVGEALKRVSLGYFQQMNTGNILNSITTGLGTLENMGIRMIDNFIGGYLSFVF